MTRSLCGLQGITPVGRASPARKQGPTREASVYLAVSSISIFYMERRDELRGENLPGIPESRGGSRIPTQCCLALKSMQTFPKPQLLGWNFPVRMGGKPMTQLRGACRGKEPKPLWESSLCKPSSVPGGGQPYCPGAAE